MWLYQRILLIIRKRTQHSVEIDSLREDTETQVKQVTHTRVNNAGHTRWPPVFGVLRTNRRASHWHPNSSTRKTGEGTRGSINRCWKEEKEEKKKNEKQQQRGWKHCYVFLVPFSMQVCPLPLSFFSRSFSFSSYPKFHTGAPCDTFYLPKAITNAPARTQVCSIVVRPTYRVLPSLLCVWPL